MSAACFERPYLLLGTRTAHCHRQYRIHQKLSRSCEPAELAEAVKTCGIFLVQSWLMGISVATDADNDLRISSNANTVLHKHERIYTEENVCASEPSIIS